WHRWSSPGTAQRASGGCGPGGHSTPDPMLSYARGVRALDVVAHELRAPLTVIRGYLSLIEDGTYPVPPATRDGAVSLIAAKAQELDSWIDILHTTSKLANGLAAGPGGAVPPGQRCRGGCVRGRRPRAWSGQRSRRSRWLVRFVAPPIAATPRSA